MARISQFAKTRKKLKFKIRIRNRCRVCGRPRGYIRKFQMCRICFRGFALRGDHMYEFLDRLCNVVLPRVRDFRGLPQNSFDGRGNDTLGLKDQLVFPEIDYTRVDKIKGMNITLTTTARNDEQGRELLKGLGVPLYERGAA